MASDELSTKAGLETALEQRRQEVLNFFGSLPTDTFFDGSAERWSPAHQLDHLTRANRPVSQALGLPRLALAAFGGTRQRLSRSYEELRDTYRVALASGGRASGQYLPDLKGQEQAQIVQGYDATFASLLQNLARWPEADLDRYQLPHPLLGPLTVRELLYFTLYHNGHHLESMRARLGGTDLASTGPAR